MTLRVLDLFSGIGGFSLGLERAGMQTVAFCEIEPYCRAVLRKHWPTVPIFEDVCKLRAEDVGTIDVICGGFPCTDISLAGKRAGLEGEHSGLWSEYRRLIRDLQPAYVIVENTASLLSLGMGTVIGDLAALGYDAEWHCIPASHVGADHIRDRVWIIAYPDANERQSINQRGRIACQAEMGEDVADDHGARPSRRMQTGTHSQDARAISPWLGLAISAAPDFPGLDGSGAPVLGRGENGIPNRVDRMHALGNAVVPQIPEIIGRAIIAAFEEMAKGK